MSLSLEVYSGVQGAAPRVLLYGIHGIGKSSWAADIEDHIFIQTENRLRHINCTRLKVAETWTEALEQLEYLASVTYNFKCINVDSIDWLEKLIHAHLCEQYGEENIAGNSKGSPFAFQRGYALANDLFRKFLNVLDYLNNTQDVQVTLISHAEIEEFKDPMRENYHHYFPAVHKYIRKTVLEWCDCVLFANYQTYVKSEEGGFGKKIQKAIGDGERLIYTEKRPAFEAKNSYDLPPEMTLPKIHPYHPFKEAIEKWRKEQGNNGLELQKLTKEKKLSS